MHHLTFCVVIIFQSDAREWVQNKLQTVHSDTRRGDPVLAEVKMLVHLLQDCSTILTPAYSIAQYFNKISVDYFRVTSLCMESKVGVPWRKKIWIYYHVSIELLCKSIQEQTQDIF